MESPTFQELPYPADSTINSEQAVAILFFGSYPSSLHTKTHLQFRAKLLAFSSVSAFPTLLYHIFIILQIATSIFRQKLVPMLLDTKRNIYKYVELWYIKNVMAVINQTERSFGYERYQNDNRIGIFIYWNNF